MSLRILFPRRPLHLHHPRLQKRHIAHPHRNTSTSSSTRTRIDKLLSRLPRFLHPYTSGLRNAPVSHITSFLILHEITAIVPLIGLATAFHYSNWLPEKWVQGSWLERGVGEGVERFGRYFGRKGWFGFTPLAPSPSSTVAESEVESAIPSTAIVTATAANPGTGIAIAMDTPFTSASASASPSASPSASTLVGSREAEGQVEVEEYVHQKWHASEGGTRILVEVATAYAITKVLLPVRVVVSVWAAPWFARVMLGRIGRLVGRVRGRGLNGGARPMSGAAGTGATGGGVIGKGP
ncbi:hypothetical protein DL98DRAFT_577542 [Cadophora sp. DSE1049]|nr:hypothetical protein DL98DRAFT_577542 [Cadophora sp. DSE1049]